MNDTHPTAIMVFVQEESVAKGRNRDYFAEVLGLSVNDYRAFLRNPETISSEMKQAICNEFEISEELFDTLSYELKPNKDSGVPTFDEVKAALGIEEQVETV